MPAALGGTSVKVTLASQEDTRQKPLTPTWYTLEIYNQVGTHRHAWEMRVEYRQIAGLSVKTSVADDGITPTTSDRFNVMTYKHMFLYVAPPLNKLVK